jgi:hypothetical protein
MMWTVIQVTRELMSAPRLGGGVNPAYQGDRRPGAGLPGRRISPTQPSLAPRPGRCQSVRLLPTSIEMYRADRRTCATEPMPYRQ